MAEADGSIVINVDLDDKDTHRKLNTLKKEIEKTQKTISEKESAKGPLVEEAEQLNQKLREATAEAQRYKAEWLAGVGGADRKQMAAVEETARLNAQYSEALEKIDKLDNELLPAYKLLDEMEDEAGRLERKLAEASEKAVPKMAEEMQKARNKAKEFGKSITESMGESSKGIKAAQSGFANLGKRILSTAKSALFFSVLYSAFNKLKEYVVEAGKENEAFRAALGRVKGALEYSFQPILNAVLPMLTVLTNALASAISWVGAFLHAIGGNGVKANTQALQEESEALAGVGGAAEDASKSLAGFDEINKLDTSPGGSGGGGAAQSAEIESIPPETLKLPGWLQELADGIGDAIDRLKEALKRLTGSETFQDIKEIVEDLVEIGAATIIEQLATSIETIAAAFEFLDSVFSGDWKGALDSLLELQGLITKFHLLPVFALAEWILGLFGIDVDLSQWWDDHIAPWFTLEKWQGLWEDAKTAFQNGWQLIKSSFDSSGLADAWEGLKTFWSDLWGSIVEIWESYGKPVFDKIRETFKNIGDVLRNVWETVILPVWETFSSEVSDLWEKHILPLWDNIRGFVKDLGQAAVDIYNGFILPFATKIKDLALGIYTNFIAPVESWFWQTALNIYNKFIIPIVNWLVNTLGPNLAAFGSFVVTTLGDVWSNITDFLSQMISGFRGLIDFIAGAFTGDWKRAFEGLYTWFKKTFINPLLIAAETFVNQFIRVMNAVISALNRIKVTIPEWVPKYGGNSFGIHLPTFEEINIPLLAQGAVIPPNKAFMAVLGDQKSGNNIEAPEALIRRIVREETAAAGGGEQTVILQVDRQVLGEVVYRLNAEQQRRLGVSLAGV